MTARSFTNEQGWTYEYKWEGPSKSKQPNNDFIFITSSHYSKLQRHHERCRKLIRAPLLQLL